MRKILALMVAGLLLVSAAVGAETAAANLVTNGGFESGLAGWRPLWSRETGAGKLDLDIQVFHSGRSGVRITHSGENDWSFEPVRRLPVQAGDIYELTAWVQLEGSGAATLCASTWDGKGQNLNWSYGERSTGVAKTWKQLTSRLVVPEGVAELQPRVIGHGAATIHVDDFSLVKVGNLANLRPAGLRAEFSLTNSSLILSINTGQATMSVTDRRTQKIVRSYSPIAEFVVTRASAEPNQIHLELLQIASGATLKADLALDPVRPEFVLSVTGTGEMQAPLRYPYPFATETGERLVVPMNEGISFPVEDTSIEPFRLIAYGGHGICMAFWGVTDDQRGHAVIIETPDDASIRLQRHEGRLTVAPEWDAQRGQFGYTRKLRYVFFDQGGHVAIAKRYREYARQRGLFKTLAEKRAENPNVDLLVGAVNVWNWDQKPEELAKEMQTAGIERILWSRGGSAESIRKLNEMNVLTSRYDIYQDMMDPAKFPELRYVHGDWTTAAWPKDIIIKSDGDWQKGWGIEGKNGGWFYCGVICDRQALPYARERIPADLANRPFLCRFIDTTTAAPWHECYHTNHPMTRTESREWKMKLLEYVSKDMKLVTGCETGHDAAVPFLHYFEGMLSLGPYRVPDAGRNMQRIVEDVPERVAKFQLGQAYRLPLWELVYHDCVVAQWYWGDYNNKLPALWDKRDLFNVLYGTPPMFMFDRKLWQAQRERFVQSYRNTCPHVRAVGYEEMIDHLILTGDRNLQQTVFANGTVITVNFGNADYRLPSGQVVKALGYDVGRAENRK
jgi:hypothetical protein